VTPVLALLVLPLTFVAGMVVLFLRKRRNGLVFSLSFFALSAVADRTPRIGTRVGTDYPIASATSRYDSRRLS
jgi:hypothetical protein